MNGGRRWARVGAMAAFLAAPAVSAETVVSLNFDDNLATQRVALRLLNERGLKASFYINTGYVGTSGYYLNRADLAAIAAAGHEIAGHSLVHSVLTNLSASELQRHVCDDRRALVAWGFSPVSFAYPNGSYNPSVIDAVRACGYANARSVGGVGCAGCVKAEGVPPANVFAIRTPTLVVRATTLAQMENAVSDAEAAGGGLVAFIIHHVCDGCGTDTITEANLAGFLDWLRGRESRGTVVRTMAQALGAPPPSPAAPSITGLSPSGATAGAPGFSLRVDGAGFTADSAVRWNGADRPSTLVGASRIDAAIAAADIAASGSAAVTVVGPGGTSNSRSFTIAAPAGAGGLLPAIAALSPASWPAGGTAFNLTVDGRDFTAGSVVRFNGANRPGVLQGTTRLIVYIPPGDVAAPGTAAVTVFASGAGESNQLPFAVTGAGPPPPTAVNPVPSVALLTPASRPAGGSAFNLTVDGSRFVSGASVRWNGAVRTGVLQGSTRLIVYIPPGDVASPGTPGVSVVNPSPGGGASNILPFLVTGSATGGGANPVPSITGLSPSAASVGGGAFNLTVDGAGFVSGAVVRWAGLSRPGVLQGASRLIVYIPPSDLAVAGTALVGVFNPAPGGGASNSLPFAVVPAAAPAAGFRPAADPAFAFREQYAFPNPSRRGQPVTIRMRAGAADSVEVRIYDVAGRPVHQGSAGTARIIDGQFACDYVWNVAGAGSGVYVYSVTVKKQGEPDIRRVGRIGVLK